MKASHTHVGIKRHHHTHVGTNGRFDSMQATVILGKWPVFEGEVQKRGDISAHYSELLKGHCTTPEIADGNTHVYAQYTIRVDEGKRNEVVSGMKEVDIPVGVYYPKCFHEQPVFEHLGYVYGDFPESEKASREVLNLPMHPFLTEDEQIQIADTLKSLL